jgi:AcrR family transcriptional regulator
MSPRKPAVLRNGDGPGLREHLIATAARLIGERGARLAVRDIAREAQVADGADTILGGIAPGSRHA